jgi:hypothetical protein
VHVQPQIHALIHTPATWGGEGLHFWNETGSKFEGANNIWKLIDQNTLSWNQLWWIGRLRIGRAPPIPSPSGPTSSESHSAHTILPVCAHLVTLTPAVTPLLLPYSFGRGGSARTSCQWQHKKTDFDGLCPSLPEHGGQVPTQASCIHLGCAVQPSSGRLRNLKAAWYWSPWRWSWKHHKGTNWKALAPSYGFPSTSHLSSTQWQFGLWALCLQLPSWASLHMNEPPHEPWSGRVIARPVLIYATSN